MKKISIRSGGVFKEIFDYRDNRGNCYTEHRKAIFAGLSVADSVKFRSLFKELKDERVISAGLDSNQCSLHLLEDGVSFFDNEQLHENDRSNTSTNIFCGSVSNVQIQQGTLNSIQTQNTSNTLDDSKIDELIQIIRKYDSMLDEELGKGVADKIRKSVDELTDLVKIPYSYDRKKSLIAYIRDLSVNASGGLIAVGIIQLISTIMR